MADRPRIKIVSDGSPGGTRILDENDVDISTSVSGVTWEHKAGDVPKATLDVIVVNGELQAEVEAIRVKILPPPAPKPTLKLRIGPYQFNTGLYRFELTRLDPLAAYGVVAAPVAAGMVELESGALDRVYEFVADAPDKP